MESSTIHHDLYVAKLSQFDPNPTNYVDESLIQLINDMTAEHIDELTKYGEYITNIEIQDETVIPPNLEKAFYLQNSLIALYESRIINLWKTVEISMKELIAAAYSIDTKDFYKWYIIESFLKQQGIILSKLKFYAEISQIKNVNNTVKHTGLVWTKNINFGEFKRDEKDILFTKVITFPMVNQFYGRVKGCIYPFLEDLQTEIAKERLRFDDAKLLKLAVEIAERMDCNDALKFAKQFLKLYNLDSKLDYTPL